MRILNLAFRNLSRNVRRTALSLISIAIVSIIMIFFMGIIAWMKDDIRENITTYIGGDLRIRNSRFVEEEDGNPLEFLVENLAGTLAALEATPGVVTTAPRMLLPSFIYRDDRTITGLGYAVDFDRENRFMNLSSYIVQGRMPLPGTREALFSRTLAEKLGLKVGDTITMLFMTRTRGSSGVTFHVSGLVDFDDVSAFRETYFAPLDLMQRALNAGNAAMEVLVRGDGHEKPDRLAESIASRLPDAGELSIVPWTGISEFWSIIIYADITYAIMGAIFFFLGSTVIINTVIMTIYERHREIGTLGAMGMEPRDIVKLFFIEASLLGVFGAALGTLAGSLLSIPVQKYGIPLYDDFMKTFGTELSSRLYILVRPGTAAYVFVFGTIIASLSSYFPSRKASRIKPVDALREE